MKFSPNSLRFKIRVLAILILAVVLILYSALLFFNYRYMLYQELDGSLRTKAQKINNAVASYLNVLGDDRESFEFSVRRVVSQSGHHPHENKIDKLQQLWLGQAQPLGLNSDTVIFFNGQGQSVARSHNLKTNSNLVSEKEVQSALRGRAVFFNLNRGKESLRAVLLSVSYPRRLTDKQYAVFVATSSAQVLRILKQRLIFMILSVALILAIAALLSEQFAKGVLKPVQEITNAAKKINDKDLSLRIHIENIDEEMKDLVNSLNDMMARLEKSFKYIAEFSSHVSHELKTPLAILRGESELALRSDHPPEEYRKMIQSNLEEINRMTKIINDLLLLTKLDYQPDVFKFESFDLVEFFKEIGDSTKILAGQKGLDVDVEIPENKNLRMRGDKVHLRRLFFNLIDNAIKFTNSQGKVGLSVKAQEKQAMVSVTDTGVGISESNLPQVFDKFFHLDGVESEGVAGGNGLGLSIAQSIARIHRGEIQAKSFLGKGSTFIVRLPLS